MISSLNSASQRSIQPFNHTDHTDRLTAVNVLDHHLPLSYSLRKSITAAPERKSRNSVRLSLFVRGVQKRALPSKERPSVSSCAVPSRMQQAKFRAL